MQNRNRRSTRLTSEIVEQMRALSESGVSRKEIATQFGVNRDTVDNAVSGRTWSTAADAAWDAHVHCAACGSSVPSADWLSRAGECGRCFVVAMSEAA